MSPLNDDTSLVSVSKYEESGRNLVYNVLFGWETPPQDSKLTAERFFKREYEKFQREIGFEGDISTLGFREASLYISRKGLDFSNSITVYAQQLPSKFRVTEQRALDKKKNIS